MIWRRKTRKHVDEEQAMPTATVAATVTSPEEIRRAEQAALAAAQSLAEAQARRQHVDQTIGALEQAIRENGFADMIRQAFGG